MDMSFISDPNWINERQELWRWMIENSNIAAETSPAQLDALQHYFFTGEVTDGEPKSLSGRLKLFPVVSVESIQHVLQHNYPEARGEKTNTAELTTYLLGGVFNTNGVSLEQALQIFHHAFGEKFCPEWKIPYLINNETGHRIISLNPYSVFESGARSVFWLSDKEYPKRMWDYLLDFWFSVLEYVDPVVFRPWDGLTGEATVLDKYFPADFWRLLGYCAHDIDVTDGSEDGAERREYMRHFRENMETLSGPSDFLQLWEEVKNTVPEKFLEPKTPWEPKMPWER